MNSSDVISTTNVHCHRGELVGSFGIFVQGILGAVAFSTLFIKRWREPKSERRTWKIWFYDTSKQGFGTMFIHFANVFLADAVTVDDPCTWYLISFLLDSTIGLLIIYVGLKFTQYVVRRQKCSSLYFGEYGYPPRCNAWLGQCALYLIVMLIEKVLVGLMVIPPFWLQVRHIMLSWIKSPQVEVLVVMLLVPFVVNAFMFWVVDNFLMRKPSSALKHNLLQTSSTQSRRKKAGDSPRKSGDGEITYFKIKSSTNDVVVSSSENRDSDEEVLLLHNFATSAPSPEKNREEVILKTGENSTEDEL